MDIGRKIKIARKKAGITQRDLASQLGINAVNISQIETGGRVPTLDTVQKISDAIGIDIRELLAYGEETDKDFEAVVLLLRLAGLEIDAAGYSGGPDEAGDHYYVWHTDAEDPERDRIEITYSDLLRIVNDAERAANIKRSEFLRKRLDADLF